MTKIRESPRNGSVTYCAMIIFDYQSSVRGALRSAQDNSGNIHILITPGAIGFDHIYMGNQGERIALQSFPLALLSGSWYRNTAASSVFAAKTAAKIFLQAKKQALDTLLDRTRSYKDF